jgi:hypothetical protein
MYDPFLVHVELLADVIWRYWLTAVANLARLKQDESLLEAAEHLWQSTTERKMYISVRAPKPPLVFNLTMRAGWSGRYRGLGRFRARLSPSKRVWYVTPPTNPAVSDIRV